MARITLSDYFAGYAGHAAISDAHRANAEILLVKVNAILLAATQANAADIEINPKTGTLISGEKNGGWRPPECPVGAPNSAHKTGQAVDIYDPDGEIDTYCADSLSLLAKHELFLEEPGATRGWCHLSTRRPRSGNRVFQP